MHFHKLQEWFADVVKEVGNLFYSNPDFEVEIRELAKKVMKQAGLFQELADICLLVLHLEIRVHCFFYLLPMAQKGEFSPNVDSQNADVEVVQLNKDLSNIEYILSTSLQAVKIRVSSLKNIEPSCNARSRIINVIFWVCCFCSTSSKVWANSYQQS